MTKRRANTAVALVSGWALLDAQLERHRADAGFVLSDHADHVDLLETIESTGARRVYTTHGDAEALAYILTQRGIDAVPLAARPIDEDGDS
jgi:putative mRNA 3-end processing factor